MEAGGCLYFRTFCHGIFSWAEAILSIRYCPNHHHVATTSSQEQRVYIELNSYLFQNDSDHHNGQQTKLGRVCNPEASPVGTISMDGARIF